MQPIDLALNDLGHEWIGLVAPLVGLGIFAVLAVLLLRLRIDLGVGRRLARTLGLLTRRMARLARRAPRARGQPATLAVLPVAKDGEWQALTGSIETSADRLRSISALQERASQSIEAAEYTLDRLLADCAAALPTRERASVLHQHTVNAEVLEPPPASLAA